MESRWSLLFSNPNGVVTATIKVHGPLYDDVIGAW